MTVFKTFLKILNKNKVVVILYSFLLVLFAGFNVTTDNTAVSTFTTSKPRVLVVNNDKDGDLSKDLVKYLNKNIKPSKIDASDTEVVKDALFYREIEYIVYIPENYSVNFFNNKNPELEIKSTGSYDATVANMLLTRYIKAATLYKDIYSDKEELFKSIHDSLKNDVKVDVESKLNTDNMERVAFYFNFESYSIVACVIYIIGIIMITFNQIKVKKRTLISSMNQNKYNFILFKCNLLYAFAMWLFYTLLAVFLYKDIVFTINGLLFLINSLVLTISVTSLAFLVANIINSKDALTGVMNVIAIGSSFMCGVFVPMDYLPGIVRIIGHIFPSYYYVEANNTIMVLDKFGFSDISYVLVNMLIMMIYAAVFIILTNYVTKKKRKIA